MRECLACWRNTKNTMEADLEGERVVQVVREIMRSQNDWTLYTIYIHDFGFYSR